MAPILGIYASQISGHLAAPNSYASIATVTVGSGGASSITFSSIPSTYTHLQIRGLVRSNRANTIDVAGVQIGSTYATQQHILYGDGSNAISNATTGLTIVPAASTTSSVFGNFVIDILDYRNTSKNVVARALSGYDANGSGTMALGSALFLTTGPVTALSVYAANGTGFVQYSSIALYGVK